MAIIGRNLVKQPRMLAPGEPLEWWRLDGNVDKDTIITSYIAERAGADVITEETGYRITGANSGGFIGVTVSAPGDPFPAGAPFRVFGRMGGLGSDQLMALVPLVPVNSYFIPLGPGLTGATYMAADTDTRDQLLAAAHNFDASGEYINREWTGVIPNVEGMKFRGVSSSTIRDVELTNTEVEWLLVFDGGNRQNTLGVSAALFDYDTGYGDSWATGYFDGDVDDDGDVTYSWSGDPFASISLATVPSEPDPEDPDPEDPDPEDPDPEDPDPEDPDPEDPEPEPSEYVNTVAGRVATALSVDTTDNEAMAIVLEGANTVIMFAYAYCRGNGFTMTGAGDIVTDKPDITAAIVAGATRYVANPTGLEYRAGTETVSGAFSGWTLAEQAVLNNYRKRWA